MIEPTPEQIEAAYSAFMRSNAGDRSAIKDAIIAAQQAAPPVMIEPTPEQIEARIVDKGRGKPLSDDGSDMLVARPVPDGWQLVPKKPTEEMLNAGWKKSIKSDYNIAGNVYENMLDAAPTPGKEPTDG